MKISHPRGRLRSRAMRSGSTDEREDYRTKRLARSRRSFSDISRHPSTKSELRAGPGLSCRIGLAETIATVSDREGSVRLRRHLEPIRRSIVLRWWRRSARPRRRWRNGEARLFGVGDEDA